MATVGRGAGSRSRVTRRALPLGKEVPLRKVQVGNSEEEEGVVRTGTARGGEGRDGHCDDEGPSLEPGEEKRWK